MLTNQHLTELMNMMNPSPNLCVAHEDRMATHQWQAGDKQVCWQIDLQPKRVACVEVHWQLLALLGVHNHRLHSWGVLCRDSRQENRERGRKGGWSVTDAYTKTPVA